VGQRTSNNIWHSPVVRLSCEDGQGFHEIVEKTIAVSRFPSHRVWINAGDEGIAIWERDQKALSDLWTASGTNPFFVIEREGRTTYPRF